MKLILGDPGKPDGWIPPDSFKSKFEDDKNGENQRLFKINGLEVRLFNITGNIKNFSVWHDFVMNTLMIIQSNTC